MASLESLANPLERLSVLPTTMNWRKNPITGTAVWDSAIQYFVGDMVTDPVTTGAFVMSGGAPPTEVTAYRGGLEPSTESTGVNPKWVSLAPSGVSFYDALTPTIAVAGANVLTVTNGSLTVPENSEWMVVVNSTAAQSAGGGFVAGDAVTWTVTGDGTGGTSSVVDVPSLVGAAASRGSASFYVSVGATGTSVALTGAWAGVQPTGVTASVLLVRLF